MNTHVIGVMLFLCGAWDVLVTGPLALAESRTTLVRAGPSLLCDSCGRANHGGRPGPGRPTDGRPANRGQSPAVA